MKKILWLVTVAGAFIYGTGAFKFSENGVNRYLNELETLSLSGQADKYCEHLDEDMTVSIHDATSDQGTQEIEGGKADLCGYVAYAAKGMELLGLQTEVTRNDFKVERDWLHPWTANVSYNEVRTSRMTRVNMTLHTASEDRWTLVNTLSGIKVKRLESKAWRTQ